MQKVRTFLFLLAGSFTSACGITPQEEAKGPVNLSKKIQSFRATWTDSNLAGPPDANGNRPCADSHILTYDDNEQLVSARGCLNSNSYSGQGNVIALSAESLEALKDSLSKIDLKALQANYVTIPTRSDQLYPRVTAEFSSENLTQSTDILSDDPSSLPSGIGTFYHFLMTNDQF